VPGPLGKGSERFKKVSGGTCSPATWFVLNNYGSTRAKREAAKKELVAMRGLKAGREREVTEILTRDNPKFDGDCHEGKSLQLNYDF